MARSIGRAMLVVCAFAGLAAGTTACGSGSDTVSKDDVVSQIKEKMTDSAGSKPSSVTCPSDLDAKVGAVVDCTMTVKGDEYGVNVTVTSVDGDQVKFDMVETVDKNDVAQNLSEELAAQIGAKPEKVTCPENLKGIVGTTLRCEVTDGGQSLGITVTVTGIDGGAVAYDYQVDG